MDGLSQVVSSVPTDSAKNIIDSLYREARRHVNSVDSLVKMIEDGSNRVMVSACAAVVRFACYAADHKDQASLLTGWEACEGIKGTDIFNHAVNYVFRDCKSKLSTKRSTWADIARHVHDKNIKTDKFEDVLTRKGGIKGFHNTFVRGYVNGKAVQQPVVAQPAPTAAVASPSVTPHPAPVAPAPAPAAPASVDPVDASDHDLDDIPGVKVIRAVKPTAAAEPIEEEVEPDPDEEALPVHTLPSEIADQVRSRMLVRAFVIDMNGSRYPLAEIERRLRDMFGDKFFGSVRVAE